MLRSISPTGLILPALLIVGAYFTFTAVQGNHGLFRRIQIEAEVDRLSLEFARLEAETERMEILTRRLSDDYLDLDLLDERVRAVLGYARPDELILP
ncbi:septum formation initiator family protein [Roseibacterium beibuensis]|uniref:Septum formation initiator family protein n=1 Tax=[Roseibacterium] beibuensis TaxID=1193142 RepID=A0ABP9LLV3_9RHOB|nr:septum formation initiator family protein [Roseibacterium beibuensis]MCS6625840.1 septum formation initiator family protein [Roseibacterium beibuensis]